MLAYGGRNALIEGVRALHSISSRPLCGLGTLAVLRRCGIQPKVGNEQERGKSGESPKQAL